MITPARALIINDCCVCPEAITFSYNRSYSSLFIRNFTWYSLFRTLYDTPFVVFVFGGAGAVVQEILIVKSQPLADGWDEMEKHPVDVSEFHHKQQRLQCAENETLCCRFKGSKTPLQV